MPRNRVLKFPELHIPADLWDAGPRESKGVWAGRWWAWFEKHDYGKGRTVICPDGSEMGANVRLEALLRGPGACAWNRAQGRGA